MSHLRKIASENETFFFFKKKYINFFHQQLLFSMRTHKKARKILRDINSRLISLNHARCEISRMMG